MYSFRQILNYMDSERVFSCKVVTYDHNRKEGGDIIELSGKMLKHNHRDKGGRELTQQELKQYQRIGLQKNPHHRKWYTRNIQIWSDGIPTIVIKKIHIPLIVEFNGEQVTP
jgi:hypothetical protein